MEEQEEQEEHEEQEEQEEQEEIDTEGEEELLDQSIKDTEALLMKQHEILERLHLLHRSLLPATWVVRKDDQIVSIAESLRELHTKAMYAITHKERDPFEEQIESWIDGLESLKKPE